MSDVLQEWAEEIRAGDRRALSRAITLVESILREDQEKAAALLELLPVQGKAKRIGISGQPGVGKSSFIEKYGLHLIEQGHHVAVLAVDPSSVLKGGSLLGDKTRMSELACHERAYVRPSPSSGHLGGIAEHTSEAMRLCEAAGYDMILVETVGVGQSEVELSQMVDVFLFMMLPGGGDDVQGLKRGIFEVVDIVAINKAEEGMLPQARRMQKDLQSALALTSYRDDEWKVPVELISVEKNEGLENVYDEIQDFLT